MPATGEDITHWCGDSRTITIPVLDVNGAAVALPGATARWWMGKNARATGDNVYVQKSTSDGIAITGPATVGGVANVYSLSITLDPEDTEDLKPGSWYHEAEVVDASGNVSTVTIGTFILKRDLVRT